MFVVKFVVRIGMYYWQVRMVGLFGISGIYVASMITLRCTK
jgi:hypothetical protein